MGMGEQNNLDDLIEVQEQELELEVWLAERSEVVVIGYPIAGDNTKCLNKYGNFSKM